MHHFKSLFQQQKNLNRYINDKYFNMNLLDMNLQYILDIEKVENSLQ